MHALIVVAHPNPQSLTHHVAATVRSGIEESGHSAEIADLAAEGFDPRYSAADQAAYVKGDAIPDDVAAEQARIDRSDSLVLVYPIYWWSFPGLLKGWIDRVFVNGWAYQETDAGIEKKLARLMVHLVGIGGADLGTYARRGYQWAMRTQIEHGIFDYCGASVVRSELFLPPESGDWSEHLATARTIGADMFRDERVEIAA
ncbi:NAD(P)H-dependent oxidoreductase [Allosphingosinicella deserti]|uniref:NAD(P)H dehydrogenase n=1 Tax=Allosphingosinicella deserti TaxID=2116704 RepID=A0A2P7QRH2_9SPHN|nr:NAD(P)H-dependent oxidoreductase [Sphingomonas deserti]PSJ40547.1 NAD(P)H dehydrogenase [Sphingomonas deserti]